METRMDVDGKRRCNDGCCLISESHMGPETHFTNIAHPGTANAEACARSSQKSLARFPVTHGLHISRRINIFNAYEYCRGSGERERWKKQGGWEERGKEERRGEEQEEGNGCNSRPAKRPLCLYFDFMKSAVPLLLLSFLPPLPSVIAVTYIYDSTRL